jgi:hypothetical protein
VSIAISSSCRTPATVEVNLSAARYGYRLSAPHGVSCTLPAVADPDRAPAPGDPASTLSRRMTGAQQRVERCT